MARAVVASKLARKLFLSTLLLAAPVVFGVGCDLPKDAPIPPFEVMIKVESDPGVPLPGAVVIRNGKDLAATGVDGKAKLTIAGNDGDTSDFMVRCPADFTSPTKAISITIRHLSDNRMPEYSTNCPPNVRKVVVAVRADGGPNLPILYLGKPVGKTDAAGAAHLLLAMKPGDQFQLGLDTTDPSLTRLEPKMPTHVFVVKDSDDIEAFDVKFTLDKLKPVYHAAPRRPQPIPPRHTN
ncbi:MAG: hypothetical protein ABI461_23935 [Polyangiaceae bacterium]